MQPHPSPSPKMPRSRRRADITVAHATAGTLARCRIRCIWLTRQDCDVRAAADATRSAGRVFLSNASAPERTSTTRPRQPRIGAQPRRHQPSRNKPPTPTNSMAGAERCPEQSPVCQPHRSVRIMSQELSLKADCVPLLSNRRRSVTRTNGPQ